MFKFNNTHIFTGYLKQLLSTVNIPACKIYTQDFANYLDTTGKEDPCVVESFGPTSYKISESEQKTHVGACINYLRNNEVYNYFWDGSIDGESLAPGNPYWKKVSSIFYSSDKDIPGLTKTLKSPGGIYDTVTHEYLGDFLRFLRDYYGLNLMSLYNCFNNKICNNIYYAPKIKILNRKFNASQEETDSNKKYIDNELIFDSNNSNYHIYAIPVKLFSEYTIAIDSSCGVELFCGLYGTTLEDSEKAYDLFCKTYTKVDTAIFNQPFIYDKLTSKYWSFSKDYSQTAKGYPILFDNELITRWDILNREQDLKLFIKIPAYCRSSIVVLEGNFKHFNDAKYEPFNNVRTLPQETRYFKGFEYFPNKKRYNATWKYSQNHSVVNFGSNNTKEYKKFDINAYGFTPISRLQLLAINTGESYPFADRLVEYFSGSTITSIDGIPDNIKRVQNVMGQNQHYFKISGIWENKIQKIIYDYIINSGPIDYVAIATNSKASDGSVNENYGTIVDPETYNNKNENRTSEYVLLDKRTGSNPKIGHTTKSTLYDILGYIDKEAEKWYTSWALDENKDSKTKKVKAKDNIQNTDIYEDLYNI